MLNHQVVFLKEILLLQYLGIEPVLRLKCQECVLIDIMCPGGILYELY